MYENIEARGKNQVFTLDSVLQAFGMDTAVRLWFHM